MEIQSVKRQTFETCSNIVKVRYIMQRDMTATRSSTVTSETNKHSQAQLNQTLMLALLSSTKICNGMVQVISNR